MSSKIRSLASRCPRLASLAWLEQLREAPLPATLLLRSQQRRDHLLLAQQLDRSGRVVLHVAAGRQTAELGQELLAFLAEHEIGRQLGSVRVWRLGVDRDLPKEQRDRIEREDLDRRAGKLHIAREID